MHLRRGGDRASRCRHCWGVGAWRHPCTSRPSHSGDLQQPGPARAGGAGTAAPRAGAGHRGRSARRSVGGEGGRGGGSGDSGDGGEPRRSVIGNRPRGANGRSRGTQLACLAYKAGLPLMQDGVAALRSLSPSNTLPASQPSQPLCAAASSPPSFPTTGSPWYVVGGKVPNVV